MLSLLLCVAMLCSVLAACSGNNEDGTVVLDNDQVKIVVRNEVSVEEFIGPCIYVYAYNKTQQRIFITMEGVQANGTDADAA